MTTRQFSPPWTIDEREGSFIVRDKNGQALAYVYFESDPSNLPGSGCAISGAGVIAPVFWREAICGPKITK